MSQAEDMDAIDRYMRTTPINPQNAEAFAIKHSWMSWWDNNIKNSWFTKAMSAEAYDEARTRRNQFSIANAKPQDRAAVREVIARGIESEEMKGGVKPPIDPETGRVGTQVTKPTVQHTPSTKPTQGQPLAASPSGNAPVALTRTLSQGVTDNGKGDVKAWQTFLGIVPATGNFGPTTVEKTKAWQRANGLTADGKVGPATWAKAFPGGPTAPSASDFAPPPENPNVTDLFTSDMPTIRRGSKGDAVKRWQSIIGVTADGNFGPATESATKKWQSERGLVADGVVGPKTWTQAGSSAAFAPSPKPAPKSSGSAFAPSPAPKPTPTPKPTAPKTTASGKPTIRRGSKGDAVKEWQTIIGVTADGIFGPATESATKKWQKDHGLTADGVVGPLTWAAAESAGGSKKAIKEKAKAKAKRVAATVKHAGILDLGSWPLWAKIGGILTIVGAAGAAAMGKKPLRIGVSE